ncbi:hypothetical protein [Robbsia sp. KACC 23696]|uniref:hypothetical protein n=1 Tax=Robbsia sp. KACC 23696 TaxID=3149231 RepID=UPI00325BACF0
MKAGRRTVLRAMARHGSAALVLGRGGLWKTLAGTPLGVSTASAFAASCATPLLGGCQAPGLAQGLVWQLDNAHIDPAGRWDALGVTDLMVQWSAVDGIAFVPLPDPAESAAFSPAPRLPEWRRIADMPWAQRILMGLAGMSSEPHARAAIPTLVAQSRQLAEAIRRQRSDNGTMPLDIEGWYFPVEVDPTWAQAPQLREALANLPRPLWISVYDRSNIGGAALARWLASWLADDIGVLFQDGVGVYARTAPVARSYVDALVGRFGAQRVRVIAEAFRPLPPVRGDTPASAAAAETAAASAPAPLFRAATADELRPQLLAYQGYRVYLFDGPHYVSNQLVERLLQ